MVRFKTKTLKILIIGSEGFVGKNLVQGLRKSHKVFTADQIENNSDKNYTQLNILDYENVEKTVTNIDVVVNLVAHTLISSLSDVIKNAELTL
jgi:dTDP-4-dehydrorhamnose reductase